MAALQAVKLSSCASQTPERAILSAPATLQLLLGGRTGRQGAAWQENHKSEQCMCVSPSGSELPPAVRKTEARVCDPFLSSPSARLSEAE